MSKLLIIITFLTFITATLVSHADSPRFMPVLSNQRVNNNFLQAKNGFEKRWKAFAKNKKFAKYNLDFDSESLAQQFENIKKTRATVYFDDPNQHPRHVNPDFERSQILMTNGYFKSLHHIAFEYNYSHPSYNSSNITLDGYRFLALEGPQKPAHVNNFLRLLINYDTKQVVRLTRDIDNGVFKTENYWKDAIKTNESSQQLLSFNLAEEDESQPYSILYYATDDWHDFAGTDPGLLLNIVQSVRRDYKPGGIIAVHCSAGVGRTGTFIAGFLLLEEIDKHLQAGTPKHKLNISIEEVVYKLSLQRAYLVSEPGQYLNLHQMVEMYLEG